MHASCLALQHTHSPVADCKPRPSQRDGRGCPGQWVAVTRASIAWSISYYYKVVSWRLCLAVAELGTFATLFVSRRAVRSSLLPPSRPRCLFVCVSLRKDCFRFRRPPALQCKSEWGDDGELVVRVSMRESKFKYSRRHAYIHVWERSLQTATLCLEPTTIACGANGSVGMKRGTQRT